MLYAIGRFLLGIYFHLFYRIRVEGAENLPKAGGVVLCANHISHNDPMVLGVVTKRRVYYLAKKELFNKKFFAAVLKRLGAIAVDRSTTDLTAYKAALKQLKDNNVVGVFVQGTRIAETEVTAAKTGAALFALKSGACVVPTYIASSYKWFTKVNIKYGKPIFLDKYKDLRFKSELLDEITNEIVNSINELKV